MSQNYEERPKCDYCAKPAVANYQKLWHKFNINGAGEYEEETGYVLDNNNPIEQDNLHLCADHIKSMGY